MEEERFELCGMYFRKNPTGKKWENICFSDLSDADKIEIMQKEPPEFTDRIMERLADVYCEMITLVKQTYLEEQSKEQKMLGVIRFNNLMRGFAKSYGITKNTEEDENE